MARLLLLKAARTLRFCDSRTAFGMNPMKRYSPPVLSDYGSIADCTFATPARGGNPNTPGGGPFACGPTAGIFHGGGKSQQELQCDKFGEYSHASTFETSVS